MLCGAEIIIPLCNRKYQVSLEPNKVFPANQVINKVINAGSLSGQLDNNQIHLMGGKYLVWMLSTH